jgi:hypothetical protein
MTQQIAFIENYTEAVSPGNLHERSEISFVFATVSSELGFKKSQLNKLNNDREIVWDHAGIPGNDVNVMRAAIEKRSSGEFYFSAVDTISPECHVLTFGHFIIERNRLILLKDEPDQTASATNRCWISFCEIIRKIRKSPLVVDGFQHYALLVEYDDNMEDINDGNEDFPF